MICSTLSGMIAVKHPTLGVLVREDGMVFNRVGRKTDKYAWTKGWESTEGYYKVTIRGKKHYVHRIVAETFIRNPENKPTVDHVNRQPSDNRVCNLRWASHKEQQENSVNVLNRTDYGVRACENKNQYAKDYYKAHRAERLEYHREYYLEKKKLQDSRCKKKIT